MTRFLLKKLRIAFVLCVLILPLLGTTVYAEESEPAKISHGIPIVSIDPANGTMTLGADDFATQDKQTFWNSILGEGRNFVVGVSGVGALFALGVFVINFIKLATSSGNPQARTQALTGILWGGIAAAGLGSVVLISGMFYGLLK